MQKLENILSLMEVASDRYFQRRLGAWIFRGQANANWPIVPSVGRLEDLKSRPGFEDEILTSFRHNAHDLLPNMKSDEWEWLAYCQHHGIPTRLLDFSLNPLVALFFAVNSENESDGKFIAFNSPKNISRNKLPYEIGRNVFEELSPFDIYQHCTYTPCAVTPRIKAQESIFVAFHEPQIDLTHDLHHDLKVDMYLIPSSCKKIIREELFRIGIHPLSLFPDIHGVVSYTKWQHEV